MIMGNKMKKSLFNKKKQIGSKVDSQLDEEQFYQMLLKFKKRHPLFDLEIIMSKLNFKRL